MQNIDHLVKILSSKMDFIDRNLINRRLHTVQSYLSSWNGSNTSMDSLFPSYALNKMMADHKFRICRGFDALANKNYFGLIAVNSNHVNDTRDRSWRYVVFVLDDNGTANIYHGPSQNGFDNDEESRSLTRIALHPIDSLGNFLLDYPVECLSVHQRDTNRCCKKRIAAPLSKQIRLGVLFIVAISPSILCLSPIPVTSKPFVYLTVILFCAIRFNISYHPMNHQRNIIPWMYLTLLVSSLVWYFIDFFINFPAIERT